MSSVTSPSHPRIIADDFGIHEAVNQGILELASKGAVDAVSVMFHGNADLDLLEALVETGVEVGCHLVLVEELPCSELSPSPLPATYRSLFAQSTIDAQTKQWVIREASEQLRRAYSFGVPVAFINSHQHVHLFPPLWRTLFPLFNEFLLPVRCCNQLRLGPLKQMAVEASSLLSLNLTPLPTFPLVHPLGLQDAGRADVKTASAAAARAALLPRNFPSEFVIHPGRSTPILLKRYGHWNYSWDREWVLSDTGAFRQALWQRQGSTK